MLHSPRTVGLTSFRVDLRLLQTVSAILGVLMMHCFICSSVFGRLYKATSLATCLAESFSSFTLAANFSCSKSGRRAMSWAFLEESVPSTTSFCNASAKVVTRAIRCCTHEADLPTILAICSWVYPRFNIVLRSCPSCIGLFCLWILSSCKTNVSMGSSLDSCMQGTVLIPNCLAASRRCAPDTTVYPSCSLTTRSGASMPSSAMDRASRCTCCSLIHFD